ncbi:hypothetical protein A2160_00910 [Candidatus Beckwithbacteria bacterium RBG_13_42_9]|uniref:ABC transporter substrate-binding protein n=1 Tax=Candidatus Beckwithbacteria bacterium RBG_13_42_9 TaxID=1797457 RepID=A0A1F5E3A5_9BACT|nr:MAG: hypothetical protein A2160_00910 [Candidatus Beckwithbacteria bacterium RBG_13_42_9]
MADQDLTGTTPVSPPTPDISPAIEGQLTDSQSATNNTPPPPPWVQTPSPSGPEVAAVPPVSVPIEPAPVIPEIPPAAEVNMPPPLSSSPVTSPEPFQPSVPEPPPVMPPMPEAEGSPSPPPPPLTFSTSSLATPNDGSGLLKKILPIVAILGGLVLVALLVIKVILPKLQPQETSTSGASVGKTTTKAKVNLTYWGLWEPEQVMNQVISEYQKMHPEVNITYSQQSPKDYRERLQSALAAGNGPDIFRFHNTWVPMLKAELDTAPKGTINLDDYFPVIGNDLSVGTEVVGVPIMFDGLALYYNPRLFNQAGKNVPTSWEELRKTAINMTVYDAKGNIQTAGIALGTTNNVDNFSDILGLMLLQNGADPKNPSGQLTEDALKFYTLFTTTDRVWNETLPASTYAFATEKVAMIIAPSWKAFEIKETNPKLEFKTAPVPQLPGTNIGWATYWVEGVSHRSKNAKSAWEFLQYLSSNDTLTKLYTAEASLRLFGEPYPKKSLAATIETDPVVGAFVKQGEIAKSWYLSSRTYDNGINDRTIKYYEDAINAVVSGKSATEALQPIAAGVSQILTQYGVGSSATQK